MLKTDSIAKTAAPILLESIVQRERLFRLLDKARGKPVIWISAPGGSGKTTLVASYLKSRALSALWYRVDEKDLDPAAFFYHMGAAWQECFPDRQEPLPHLAPEYLAGITTFSRRYFGKLYELLPVPFAVVFDNYQDVSPYASLHEIIGEGLTLIPAGTTVIVLSRNEPPPLFAVPDLAGRFAVLGWSDLRFTFSETTELARLRKGKVIPKDALERLQAKTDGWIAGLLLILEGWGDGALDDQMLDRVPVNEVFDYFAAEIFGRSDRDTQDFLLKTAFSPGLTLSLAERLTGIGSSERILARLVRNQFFTEKRSETNPVYHYHPLFREFLLARAAKIFQPPELREIRRKAATLLEEAGRMEDAAGLFLEAADWESVTDLIRKHGQTLLVTARRQTLGEWLGRIPPEVMAGNVWLLYWRGVYLLALRPAEARENLTAAFGLFKAVEDYDGLFLAWSNITDTFTYEWKDFHPLDQWIAAFMEMLPRYGELPAGPVKDRVTCSMFSALLFRQPQHPDIRDWKEKAQRVMISTADTGQRIAIGHNLVYYYLWMEKVESAGVIVHSLSTLFEKDAEPSLQQAMWHVVEALYRDYLASFARSQEIVADGLAIGEKAGIHLIDLLLFGLGIYNSVMTGDRRGAAYFLGRMESARNTLSCFETTNYHHNASLVAAACRDWPAAIRHAEECVVLTRENGFVLVHGLYQYVLACILVCAGHYAGAVDPLNEVRRIARDTGSMLLKVCCSIVETLYALRRDDASGMQHLRRYFSLSREMGLKMTLFQDVTALFCTKALEAGVETEYARDLIRRHHIVPEASHVHLENWPFSLRIYTLGGFEILKDERPLAPASKVHKPLELLKALISLGGKDVPESRLIEDLWPDAKGDFAHRSFDTTLHRLRKLLGNGKALPLQAGCLSLDPRYCWCDTQALEHLCGEIEEAGRKEKGAALEESRLMPLLEKAAGLYRGHFLSADRDLPWTMRTRDRLRGKFRQIVGQAGAHWEERGQWEQAGRWYQRGIEKDGLAEEFYQRLMLCYRQQGQTVEAVRTYRRLCATLSRRLDLAPSPKTEEIYRAIVNK